MIRTSFLNMKRLPAVIELEGGERAGAGLASLLSLCRNRQGYLRAKVLEFGALLLRGYEVRTAAEFARFVRAFSNRPPLDYVGGASPRVKLGGGVYTSTEYPEHYTLSLHNELSYTYRWPAYLFFCCVTAAEHGGETPLGDSRALLKSIDGEVVDQFKAKKVRYDRNLHGGGGAGLSWQAAFETDDKAAVETYCRRGGVSFRWKGDGGLWLSQVRPATTTHPQTGEEVWFNQADGFHTSGMDRAYYEALSACLKEEDFPLNAYFGDGTPLDPAALAHVRGVMEREMVLFPWREGDVLVVDNVLTAHGRMPFSGPRKILLAMT